MHQVRHHRKTAEIDALFARVVKVELDQPVGRAAHRDGVVARHVDLDGVAVVHHTGRARCVFEQDRFGRPAQGRRFLDVDRRLALADGADVELRLELAPGLRAAFALVAPVHLPRAVAAGGGAVAGQGGRSCAGRLLPCGHRVENGARRHGNMGRLGGVRCNRPGLPGWRCGRWGTLAVDHQRHALLGVDAGLDRFAHLVADGLGRGVAGGGGGFLGACGRCLGRRGPMALGGGRANRAQHEQQACKQGAGRCAAVGQGGSGQSVGSQVRHDRCIGTRARFLEG